MDGTEEETARAARAGARALEAGELLVHPTSTLYGLGADAGPETDAELARLKGRPSSAPFIRLAADAEAVRRARPTPRWDDRTEALAGAFWPGPLTLVLEDGTPHGLSVRVDPHPLVRAILAARGGLMTSTSVNRSGEPPASSPAEVRRELGGLPESRRPVTFLNAGPLAPSPPSTLVSLRERRPRLLRAGALATEPIEACLGEALEREGS